MTPADRIDAAGTLIASFIKVGLDHAQIQQVTHVLAEELSKLSAEQRLELFAMVQEKPEKLAGEKVANATLSALGSALATLLGRGANKSLDVAGNVAGQVVRTSPILLAAPLAASALGSYHAGKAWAGLTDAGDRQTKEIHHQELVGALRRNAAALRRQSHTH